MKDIIFMFTIGIVASAVCGLISYSMLLQTKQNENFAKAGLEQCQPSGVSQVIWGKNCTEYINARK